MQKSTIEPAADLPLDWDNLRYVQAVAEGGSLNAGAARLGVRHSTVLRRLDALEAQLGARLFERRRQGYLPTEAGALMVAQAAQMQSAITAMHRQILGRDAQLTGRIRINSPLVAMPWLLPGPLASFAQAHPEITLELTATAGLIDLNRRDADIALRISHQVPEHWVGRQVGDVAFKVYARRGAKGLPRSVQPLPALCQQARWLGFEQGQDARFFERWMNAQVPARQLVFRVDQFNTLVAMLHTGLGVGLLPCFVGDQEAGLVAVSEAITALQTPLWLLTHPDLRGTARISRLVQHLAQALPAALAPGQTVSKSQARPRAVS